MKSGKALLVSLALGGLGLSGGAAADVNGTYTTRLSTPCSEVLRDYAKSELVNVGKKVEYDLNFGNIIGWIAGYMTRVNYSVPGKKNYFNGLLDEVAWVASWCRDNPSEDLAAAMEALTNARTGGR